MVEQITTCPKRTGEPGLWRHDAGLDRWIVRTHVRQREPGPTVRICSFCGGVHPEDLLRLLQDGWRVLPTDLACERHLVTPEGRSVTPHLTVHTEHLDEELARIIRITHGPRTG